MSQIRVLVNGAQGKMGQETVKAINEASDLTLTAATGRKDDLEKIIKTTDSHVVVDFTSADTVYENAIKIIDAGAHPVIGSSGLTPAQILELTQRCAAKKLGGIIAPNFSIGAILMMRYAKECARYFPHVEIIELHHNKKIDSPSGTALRTAELISETKAKLNRDFVEKETIPGARGALYHDIPIHSIRLPGLVAHQAVIFGDAGQTLTIRDDTTSREAFMPGVCLACRAVMNLETLVYGLEHIL